MKIKKHLKKHKEAYIVGALAFAGFTTLIMRGRYAGVQRVPGTADQMDTVFIRPLTFLSNRTTNNVVNVLEREGRGHPGYIVRCLETNCFWPSQMKASEAMEVSKSVMSGHLNGKLPDINGLHFERIAA